MYEFNALIIININIYIIFFPLQFAVGDNDVAVITVYCYEEIENVRTDQSESSIQVIPILHAH